MSHKLPSSNYEKALINLTGLAQPGVVFAILALVDATNRQTDDMLEIVELRNRNAALLRTVKALLVSQANDLAGMEIVS